MRQAEVFSRFLGAFTELYPQLAFRGVRRFPSHTYEPYGLAFRVAFGRGSIELDLLCVALAEGFPDEVRRAAARIGEAAPITPGDGSLDDRPKVSVVIAPYMAEEARALCRAAGLGWFDLAGNAGLDTPRAFFEVCGKPNPGKRERAVYQPFEGRSERVARRLLLEHDRRWTMRALAQAADVSLGLASMTTSALAELGLLAKTRAGISLHHPAALLEVWAGRYDLRCHPLRVLRGMATVAELEMQLSQQQEALEGRCALTLWSAARHLLGDSLPATRLALYWDGNATVLARSLGLSEDKGGTSVFVFQPRDPSVLWACVADRGPVAIVHPLQLYLDLSVGDEEELQLARKVRALLPW